MIRSGTGAIDVTMEVWNGSVDRPHSSAIHRISGLVSPFYR